MPVPTLPGMKITHDVLRQSWRGWLSSDLAPPGPAWLQWVWTLLFAAVVALGFTILGMGFGPGRDGGFGLPWTWWAWYRVNFVISLVISVTIQLLFTLVLPLVGQARIRRFSGPRRAVFFTAVPLAGVAIGWPVGLWLVGQDMAGWVRYVGIGNAIGNMVLALAISLLFFIWFHAKSRQIEAEKRATEAQLRLLQGQMEPHFLFNTLANVVSLIDTDAPKAKRMLETFIDYLRASLTHLRRDDSTLGDELATVEAYLSLMQSRMGERLASRIEIADPALRAAAMPPLLLQPLVENAIHHGIEPKVDGGTIILRARAAAGSLMVTIEDDGLGLEAAAVHRAGRPGNGVAIDNLRARLRSRYGNDATLTLDLRPDAGAIATLQMPLETAPA